MNFGNSRNAAKTGYGSDQNRNGFTKMRNIIAVLLLSLLLAGCGGVEKLSNRDFADVYRKNSKLIEPDFAVYHLDDLKTEIHFRINTDPLVYVENPRDGKFTGSVKIAYKLYEDFESRTLIDSASTVIEDETDEVEEKNIYGKFDLKIPSGKDYVLLVTTGDENRDRQTQELINVQKTSALSRQNYKVINIKTGHILFRDYINAEDEVQIEYNMLTPVSKLEIDYFDKSFPVTPPPFALDVDGPPTMRPASSKKLRMNDENKATFKPEKPGLYHFKASDESLEGLTLFYFDDKFPTIKNVEEMASALRFITSKNEYEQINNHDNLKVAVDSFWLNTAGSKTRARELIKAYYNRVQNANLFFTSYKEGWKTDRGIIYMIFGPPNMVYKSAQSEAWVYGEANNHLSVNFVFNKTKSPFTDNNYMLRRSPNYKNPWYRAVETWRQGRVSALDY